MNNLAIRDETVKKALVEIGQIRSERYSCQVRRTFARYQKWAVGQPEASVINRLENYAAYLSQQGLSAGTISAYIGHLRLVIKRLAKASGDLDLLRNVSYALENIDLPKSARGERLVRWLSDAEARILLASVGGNSLEDLRDKVIIGLMLGAGLRRSELASLRWDQLSQQDGIWMIANISSKGRIRTVPILSALVRILRRLGEELGEPKDEFVLFSLKKSGAVAGNGLSSGAIREIVKRRAVKVGLVASPHDLRRTFARFAWLGGMSLPDLAKLLGHASVKTTEKYIGAGFSPDRLLPRLPWADELNVPMPPMATDRNEDELKREDYCDRWVEEFIDGELVRTVDPPAPRIDDYNGKEGNDDD